MNQQCATVLVAVITILPSLINIIFGILNTKKANKITDIKDEMKLIKEEIQNFRVDEIRRYLVDQLNDIENDIVKSEEQKKEIYKAYDYYVQHGGNSYIHTKFDRLVKENKL